MGPVWNETEKDNSAQFKVLVIKIPKRKTIVNRIHLVPDSGRGAFVLLNNTPAKSVSQWAWQKINYILLL